MFLIFYAIGLELKLLQYKNNLLYNVKKMKEALMRIQKKSVRVVWVLSCDLKTKIGRNGSEYQKMLKVN